VMSPKPFWYVAYSPDCCTSREPETKPLRGCAWELYLFQTEIIHSVEIVDVGIGTSQHVVGKLVYIGLLVVLSSPLERRSDLISMSLSRPSRSWCQMWHFRRRVAQNVLHCSLGFDS
jgi:hypothetical protein